MGIEEREETQENLDERWQKIDSTSFANKEVSLAISTEIIRVYLKRGSFLQHNDQRAPFHSEKSPFHTKTFGHLTLAMNQNTTDFDELTEKWSSGDNVYGSGCQINATAPNIIYKLAFSDESTQFFDELVKDNEESSTEPQYKISPWTEKENVSKSDFTAIKQRKLSIKATESGIAFFLRKNITTNFTQTAFFKDGTYFIRK